MKRPDRSLADAFADITLIGESTLINKGQLLDPIADDDDDNDWKTDSFEMRHMFKFSGSSWLQEQLRSLCREFIDIFSTLLRHSVLEGGERIRRVH
jgi:hypothetical protein